MTISKRLYANNAKTTLAADIASHVTSITVVDGSIFPNPGVNEYFFITLELGPKIEIVKVTSRSGNVLNGCVRAQEGKPAQSFTAGARVENRVTADSLARFESQVDTLKRISSLDLLDTPINSNSQTYICDSPDSSGNPVIAIRDTDTLWRFSTHSIISVKAAVNSATTTSLVYTSSIGLLNDLVDGKYIIQFTTGANLGQNRRLTSMGVNTIGWATALPVAPSPGDLFDIFISDASILADIADTTDNSLLAALGNRAKRGYIYFIGNF
jgi:hypothetical protein